MLKECNLELDLNKRYWFELNYGIDLSIQNQSKKKMIIKFLERVIIMMERRLIKKIKINNK